jgi:hypothetical protein
MKRFPLFYVTLALFIPSAQSQQTPDVFWTKYGDPGKRADAVAYCVSRDTLITSSLSEVVIRDFSSRELVKRFSSFINKCIAVSPDGNFVIGIGYGPSGPAFALYNIATGHQIWSKRVPSTNGSVFFSSTGEWLAGPTELQSPSISRYRKDGSLIISYFGIGHAVFSPNETLVAGVTVQGDIKVLSVENGELLRMIDTDVDHDITFSPDGSKIVGGVGDRVVTWDVATGAVVDTFGVFGGVAGNVCYSGDGQYLFVSGQNGGQFFNGGKETGRIPNPTGSFIGKGHEFYALSAGPELMHYSVDGTFLGTFPDIAGPVVGASSRAQKFVTTSGSSQGSETQSFYYLLDSISAQPQFPADQTRWNAASLFDNGELLATASTGETFGLSRVQVFDSASGDLLGTRTFVNGKVSSISETGVAAFNWKEWNKGTEIMNWGVWLVDLTNKSETLFVGESFMGFDFDNGSALSASGSNLAVWAGPPLNYTRIYDTATSEILMELPKMALRAVYSPDDDLVILEFPGQPESVRSISGGGNELYTIVGTPLAFSPDGQHIANLVPGRLLLLDADSGQLVMEFDEASENIETLVWTNGLIFYNGFERGIPYQRAIFDPFSVEHAVPIELSVIRGSIISGGLEEIVNDDGETFGIQPIGPNQTRVSPVQIEITAHTEANTASILQFRIDCQTNVPLIRQKIELFDYAAGDWTAMDTRTFVKTGGVIDINLGENVQRFLQNGSLRARVSYDKVFSVSRVPWRIDIDQIKWTMTH